MPIIGWVTAYVDESLRLTGEGLYVLAAVVVPPDRAAEVRAALRAAVPPGLRRYHWRDERPASRAAMAGIVAGLRLDALVVTARPVERTRQERARRQCLRRLVWELDRRRLSDVVLESRGHRDADDRSMIAYALRAGWGSRELRYGFARPTDEPLLWLPDVVAGAHALAIGTGDCRYTAPLAARTQVVSTP